MMHILKTLFALTLTACAALAHADPPGRVARLNHIAGAVSFAPAETPDQWTQAVLNRPLTSGDRLWADRNARAELHVGSLGMRLAPLTSVDVLNLDDQTLQIRLAQGTVNLRVRDLARDEIVEVATPTGAVLIRQPGSYRISTDPNIDVSRVVVNFGQAEVITPAQTVTVPSSQSAVIPANAAIAFEIAAQGSGDEFDRWSAERDRREDQVTATRYVSRDMTGYEDLDQHGAWRTLPEYGAVWVPTRVAHDWAPYRHGHWVWMSPWGWTWVDDAPWGFAPSHYGRWVWLDSYWGWAPGPLVRRPVYAPALVAFVGGSGFSVSARSGPSVGWFPLGWREPFIPWYRASHAHVRNVNVTHVTNVNNTTNINYINRRRPGAVTVVSQQTFVSARPVARASFAVPQNELARAEVIRDKQPAEPIRASVAPERPGQRPPPRAAAREVVAVNTPAAPAARDAPAFRERAGVARSADAEPRVRVLGRDRTNSGGVDRTQQQAAPQSDRPSQSDAAAREGQPGTHGRTAPRTPAPAAAAPQSPASIQGAATPAAAAERPPTHSAPVTVAPSSPAPNAPAAGATAPSSRAAPVTIAPPNAAAPAGTPKAAATAPQSAGTAAPAQPRAADGDRARAATRQDASRDRGADEATQNARRAEPREAREARSSGPSEGATRPPIVERERTDPRRSADPRNEPPREGAGFRRQRLPERPQEAAPAREAQVTQQAPRPLTPAPIARPAESARPREAQLTRQAPPAPVVAPIARPAESAPHREAPRQRQALPPKTDVPSPRAQTAIVPRPDAAPRAMSSQQERPARGDRGTQAPRPAHPS